MHRGLQTSSSPDMQAHDTACDPFSQRQKQNPRRAVVRSKISWATLLLCMSDFGRTDVGHQLSGCQIRVAFSSTRIRLGRASQSSPPGGKTRPSCQCRGTRQSIHNSAGVELLCYRERRRSPLLCSSRSYARSSPQLFNNLALPSGSTICTCSKDCARRELGPGDLRSGRGRDYALFTTGRLLIRRYKSPPWRNKAGLKTIPHV